MHGLIEYLVYFDDQLIKKSSHDLIIFCDFLEMKDLTQSNRQPFHSSSSEIFIFLFFSTHFPTLIEFNILYLN